MLSLGYDKILTIIIPGVIIFVALWLLLNRYDPTGILNVALSNAAEKQWLFSLVLAIASIVFGQLLAMVAGSLEIKLLDKARTNQMLDEGLIKNKGEYDEQWYSYIDSLEKAHNSYISKLSTHFHFEFRLSLSLVIISISLIPCVLTWGHMAFATILYILALYLFRQSVMIHSELVDYRCRQFGKSKSRELYYY
jgi:hypothetical protein